MASASQPEVPANDSVTSAQRIDSLLDSDPSGSIHSKSPPCPSTAPVSLRAHSTLSTVPGTPGADLSVSFLSINQPLASCQPHVPLRGTPSAVGAIHAQKSISAVKQQTSLGGYVCGSVGAIGLTQGVRR